MNKVTVNNPCKYSPDDIGLCVECGKGYSDHKDPDNLLQHPQYEEKVKSVEELVQELNILIVEQKTLYLTAIQEIKKKYLKLLKSNRKKQKRKNRMKSRLIEAVE